ncbi:DUF4198 domain-containing protein [Pedobacter sp. UC225_65]|uniref:DUF4198 domain-containing protein n=1 Tax=Pedobacter sp. UC225_65 TaxID=3350173 RepID=UPI00366CE2A5
MKKISLLMMLLTLSISSVFAHALWIETASVGKKGQAQEVKVFFGEYEGKEPDSAKKWFSNLKEFSLVLTAPDGSKKVLKTTPAVLCYKTTFTPEQDGTYILSIVHEVKDIYESAKIEYYAFANVAIGNAPKVNVALPANALFSFRPEQPVLKTGTAITHSIVYNKAPFAEQKLSIIHPDNKKEEPKTDAKGKFVFKPEQKGNYFLEAFAEDKTPGKLGEKTYDKVWHVSTYFIAVN